MVEVPGIEGGLGILPEHMPLMTQIRPGELRIATGDGDVIMAVGEGFLEVLPDRVSIMTDMAVKLEEIDEKAVVEALARVEKQMREKELSADEHAILEASLLRSVAQLDVKRRARR